MSNSPFLTFGHLRCLWGNVPAYDVLNLPENEGADYGRDLNLCFAGEFFFNRIIAKHYSRTLYLIHIASGDPRNLIESVVSLPVNYQGSCTCVINDEDPVVLCRNVVILLISVLLPPGEAAD